MDIRKDVAKLVKKYGTNNPFEIAEAMGTIVRFEHLGSIHGYYNKIFRIKQIHVNCDLPEHLQWITGGHELGHSIYHPDANTPFLKANTYLSVDKMEIEANKFSVELIIPYEELEELVLWGYSIEQIARVYGYHERLIKLRFK